MSIFINKQGIFDTIQDDGRYGFQHLGINPGGVMDTVAAAVANMLVGNKIDLPVIELHFPASSIIFNESCLMALSGADFSATINNEPALLNTAIIVTASSALIFSKYKKGARCYLAVYGGWNAVRWLNSYSTNTQVHAGGFNGGALKKNDMIHFHKKQTLINRFSLQSHFITSIRIDSTSFYSSENKIRCIKGMQYNWLNDSSKNSFVTTLFKITANSNRMGYHLSGEKLFASTSKQLLSTAVTKGAIQLLPDGGLILLMADHQTTGGYPVIANVISTDIPSLAQIQPGTSIQFRFIDIEEAEILYIQQQENLLRLQDACNLQLRQFFNTDDFN